MSAAARGRCCAPDSQGRHVLGAVDWAGRQACDCGAVRRYPPGTRALPERSPMEAAWERLVGALADVAATGRAITVAVTGPHP